MARYINHVTTQKDASSGGSTSNNNLVGNSGSASALHPSGTKLYFEFSFGRVLKMHLFFLL